MKPASSSVFSRKANTDMNCVKKISVSLSTSLRVLLPCFIQSRPINLSQRASPAAFTVTTRCVMAHQTPRHRTKCCDALMKVLSADTETAQDMARQRPLTQLEEKMVSADLVVFIRACNLKFCLKVLL